MANWIQKNGTVIELNNEKATVKKAKELGWKRETKEEVADRNKVEAEATLTALAEAEAVLDA